MLKGALHPNFIFSNFFLLLLIWTILKVFMELVTVLLLSYVLVFWCKACGI